MALERADELPNAAPPVLMALAAHADAEGTCHPSVARLATLAGLGDRAVYYALHDLERADLLRSEPRPGKPSLRRLNPCTPCRGTDGDPAPSADPCTPCTPPLHPMQGTPAPHAPEVDREGDTEGDMPATGRASATPRPEPSPAARESVGGNGSATSAIATDPRQVALAGEGDVVARSPSPREAQGASLDGDSRAGRALALAREAAPLLVGAGSAEARHRSSEWAHDAATNEHVVRDLADAIRDHLADHSPDDARRHVLAAAKRAAGQTVVSSLSGAFRTQLEGEAE